MNAGVGRAVGEEKRYEVTLGCHLPRERPWLLVLRTEGRSKSGMEPVLAESTGGEGGDPLQKSQF